MPSRDPLHDPAPLIKRVYSFAAFHVGHGAAAEDVTSDVLDRAVRDRGSYDPAKGSPLTWLLAIAQRSVAAARLDASRSIEALGDTPDGHDLEEDTIRRLELTRALGKLDERERELLALRYGAGLSSREIAKFLDLEPNAVDVALHRARARLKKALATNEPRQHAPGGSRTSAPAEN